MSISQQLGYKDRMYRVKVDFLQDIGVDKENMLVSVEPGITIGFLNRALVNMGFTLPVVPELDMLTIGGLVMGGGIESTSHNYGLFHHQCKEYEGYPGPTISLMATVTCVPMDSS
jgi:FAD/FMN-containing dehydrogenase